MTSAQVVSGQSYAIPPALVLAVMFGAPLMWRVVAAFNTSSEAWAHAHRWILTPRQHHVVQSHLKRQAWTRVIATLVLGAIALLLIWNDSAGFSVISLPILASAPISEVLAPRPRRSAVRTASLAHRGGSTFAPRSAFVVAQALIGAAVVFAAYGVLFGTDARRAFMLPHLCVLVLSFILLHASLRILSQRPLAEATDDRAVDVALRLETARSLTSYALVMGGAGLLLSSVGVAQQLAPRSVVNAFSQLLLLGVLAVTVWALALKEAQAPTL